MYPVFWRSAKWQYQNASLMLDYIAIQINVFYLSANCMFQTELKQHQKNSTIVQMVKTINSCYLNLQNKIMIYAEWLCSQTYIKHYFIHLDLCTNKHKNTQTHKNIKNRNTHQQTLILNTFVKIQIHTHRYTHKHIIQIHIMMHIHTHTNYENH